MAVGSIAATYPARLERLPLSRYQQRLFLIIALAWLFDSIDLGMLTFVLAAIAKDFHLTAAQSGFLASASFLGMLVGAGLAGMVADRIGRRAVFQVSMVLWGLGSLLCALSPDLVWLGIFRFVLGVGMGAEYPTAQSLLSEFIPAAHRGRYLAYLEGFWPLGFISAGVIALAMFRLIPGSAAWRWVFVAEAVPAVYAAVIRRGVPESPRWLASRGRLDEAEQTMQQIERAVAASLKQPLPEPSLQTAVEASSSRFSFLDLWAPGYAQRTIMVWLLWFTCLFGYYSLTTWLGAFLVRQGFAIVKSVQYVLLISLAGIPGFLSAAWAVERMGRKISMVGYILLSAAAAYLYGHAPNLTALVIWGLLMQFFLFGMWSVLYAYTPELYPTRARATGCGFASSLGRLGALIGPSVVGVVLSSVGVGGVFTLGAVVFVVGALAVALLGPETRGRTLEEISA